MNDIKYHKSWATAAGNYVFLPFSTEVSIINVQQSIKGFSMYVLIMGTTPLYEVKMLNF